VICGICRFRRSHKDDLRNLGIIQALDQVLLQVYDYVTYFFMKGRNQSVAGSRRQSSSGDGEEEEEDLHVHFNDNNSDEEEEQQSALIVRNIRLNQQEVLYFDEMDEIQIF